MKKTVFITGGSRGIGAASAREFAKCGYNVAIGCHESRQKAEEIKRELVALGADAEVFAADVSNSAEITAQITAAKRRFGRLDALVCCAGISLTKQIQDTTDADFSRVVGVNLAGAFNAVRAAAPLFIAQKSGAIVFVSSVAARDGCSTESVYAATKSALLGFSRSLAKELGQSGVRVNAVLPGLIDTDMCAVICAADKAALAASTPLLRLGTAEDVAQAICFLARHEFITGAELCVDGGLTL